MCESRRLEGAGDLDLSPGDREVITSLLRNNIAFMATCLKTNNYTFEKLQSFARGQTPLIVKATQIAASIQVAHATEVLKAWKARLGKDWEKTYAVTNSLYVTRRNNILFTVLAQQMGQDSFNDRLFLFETTEFTTQPDKMLDLLTRVVADRALGQVYFKDYYLMDVELLSDASRNAIAAQAAKDGVKPLLPTLAPFHNHSWPWFVDPNSGTGPSTLDAAFAQPK
jgi:hypothetical protein